MPECAHNMQMRPDPVTVPEGTPIELYCADCGMVAPESPLRFVSPPVGARKVNYAPVIRHGA